ncbi:MAG: helix-turn-helix transcriptional regulator [Hyphomonas sp.]|nr:helix-turn-helix transcriptional regulator [Hyphomonas sp.]
MPSPANPSSPGTRKPTDADRFVGQKVRQARRGPGLTQEALATLLGITFQQVQKYESGQTRLSAGRLRSVVIAGRKPIDYFYEPFVIATPASGLAEKGPDPGTAP